MVPFGRKFSESYAQLSELENKTVQLLHTAPSVVVKETHAGVTVQSFRVDAPTLRQEFANHFLAIPQFSGPEERAISLNDQPALTILFREASRSWVLLLQKDEHRIIESQPLVEVVGPQKMLWVKIRPRASSSVNPYAEFTRKMIELRESIIDQYPTVNSGAPANDARANLEVGALRLKETTLQKLPLGKLLDSATQHRIISRLLWEAIDSPNALQSELRRVGTGSSVTLPPLDLSERALKERLRAIGDDIAAGSGPLYEFLMLLDISAKLGVEREYDVLFDGFTSASAVDIQADPGTRGVLLAFQQGRWAERFGYLQAYGAAPNEHQLTLRAVVSYASKVPLHSSVVPFAYQQPLTLVPPADDKDTLWFIQPAGNIARVDLAAQIPLAHPEFAGTYIYKHKIPEPIRFVVASQTITPSNQTSARVSATDKTGFSFLEAPFSIEIEKIESLTVTTPGSTATISLDRYFPVLSPNYEWRWSGGRLGNEPVITAMPRITISSVQDADAARYSVLFVDKATGNSLAFVVVLEIRAFCKRCLKQYKGSRNGFGQCRFHTQHAPECERKRRASNVSLRAYLTTIFGEQVKTEPILDLIGRLSPSNYLLFQEKLDQIKAWLSANSTLQTITLFNAEKMEGVPTFFLLQDMTTGMFSLETAGRQKMLDIANGVALRNPNLYYGVGLNGEGVSTRLCCRYREGTVEGCWLGEHSAFTPVPDLHDWLLLEQRGTEQIHSMWATSATHAFIVEAKAEGNVAEVLSLEQKFNRIHGGRLHPSFAYRNFVEGENLLEEILDEPGMEFGAKLRKLYDLVDLSQPFACWLRDERLADTYDERDGFPVAKDDNRSTRTIELISLFLGLSRITDKKRRIQELDIWLEQKEGVKRRVHLFRQTPPAVELSINDIQEEARKRSRAMMDRIKMVDDNLKSLEELMRKAGDARMDRKDRDDIVGDIRPFVQEFQSMRRSFDDEIKLVDRTSRTVISYIRELGVQPVETYDDQKWITEAAAMSNDIIVKLTFGQDGFSDHQQTLADISNVEERIRRKKFDKKIESARALYSKKETEYRTEYERLQDEIIAQWSTFWNRFHDLGFQNIDSLVRTLQTYSIPHPDESDAEFLRFRNGAAAYAKLVKALGKADQPDRQLLTKYLSDNNLKTPDAFLRREPLIQEIDLEVGNLMALERGFPFEGEQLQKFIEFLDQTTEETMARLFSADNGWSFYNSSEMLNQRARFTNSPLSPVENIVKTASDVLKLNLQFGTDAEVSVSPAMGTNSEVWNSFRMLIGGQLPNKPFFAISLSQYLLNRDRESEAAFKLAVDYLIRLHLDTAGQGKTLRSNYEAMARALVFDPSFPTNIEAWNLYVKFLIESFRSASPDVVNRLQYDLLTFATPWTEARVTPSDLQRFETQVAQRESAEKEEAARRAQLAEEASRKRREELEEQTRRRQREAEARRKTQEDLLRRKREQEEALRKKQEEQELSEKEASELARLAAEEQELEKRKQEETRRQEEAAKAEQEELDRARQAEEEARANEERLKREAELAAKEAEKQKKEEEAAKEREAQEAAAKGIVESERVVDASGQFTGNPISVPIQPNELVVNLASDSLLGNFERDPDRPGELDVGGRTTNLSTTVNREEEKFKETWKRIVSLFNTTPSYLQISEIFRDGVGLEFVRLQSGSREDLIEAMKKALSSLNDSRPALYRTLFRRMQHDIDHAYGYDENNTPRALQYTEATRLENLQIDIRPDPGFLKRTAEFAMGVKTEKYLWRTLLPIFMDFYTLKKVEPSAGQALSQLPESEIFDYRFSGKSQKRNFSLSGDFLIDRLSWTPESGLYNDPALILIAAVALVLGVSRDSNAPLLSQGYAQFTERDSVEGILKRIADKITVTPNLTAASRLNLEWGNVFSNRKVKNLPVNPEERRRTIFVRIALLESYWKTPEDFREFLSDQSLIHVVWRLVSRVVIAPILPVGWTDFKPATASAMDHFLNCYFDSKTREQSYAPTNANLSARSIASMLTNHPRIATRHHAIRLRQKDEHSLLSTIADYEFSGRRDAKSIMKAFSDFCAQPRVRFVVVEGGSKELLPKIVHFQSLDPKSAPGLSVDYAMTRVVESATGNPPETKSTSELRQYFSNVNSIILEESPSVSLVVELARRSAEKHLEDERTKRRQEIWTKVRAYQQELDIQSESKTPEEVADDVSDSLTRRYLPRWKQLVGSLERIRPNTGVVAHTKDVLSADRIKQITLRQFYTYQELRQANKTLSHLSSFISKRNFDLDSATDYDYLIAGAVLLFEEAITTEARSLVQVNAVKFRNQLFAEVDDLLQRLTSTAVDFVDLYILAKQREDSDESEVGQGWEDSIRKTNEWLAQLGSATQSISREEVENPASIPSLTNERAVVETLMAQKPAKRTVEWDQLDQLVISQLRFPSNLIGAPTATPESWTKLRQTLETYYSSGSSARVENFVRAVAIAKNFYALDKKVRSNLTTGIQEEITTALVNSTMQRLADYAFATQRNDSADTLYYYICLLSVLLSSLPDSPSNRLLLGSVDLPWLRSALNVNLSPATISLLKFQESMRQRGEEFINIKTIRSELRRILFNEIERVTEVDGVYHPLGLPRRILIRGEKPVVEYSLEFQLTNALPLPDLQIKGINSFLKIVRSIPVDGMLRSSISPQLPKWVSKRSKSPKSILPDPLLLSKKGSETFNDLEKTLAEHGITITSTRYPGLLTRESLAKISGDQLSGLLYASRGTPDQLASTLYRNVRVRQRHPYIFGTPDPKFERIAYYLITGKRWELNNKQLAKAMDNFYDNWNDTLKTLFGRDKLTPDERKISPLRLKSVASRYTDALKQEAENREAEMQSANEYGSLTTDSAITGATKLESMVREFSFGELTKVHQRSPASDSYDEGTPIEDFMKFKEHMKPGVNIGAEHRFYNDYLYLATDARGDIVGWSLWNTDSKFLSRCLSDLEVSDPNDAGFERNEDREAVMQFLAFGSRPEVGYLLMASAGLDASIIEGKTSCYYSLPLQVCKTEAIGLKPRVAPQFYAAASLRETALSAAAGFDLGFPFQVQNALQRMKVDISNDSQFGLTDENVGPLYTVALETVIGKDVYDLQSLLPLRVEGTTEYHRSGKAVQGRMTNKSHRSVKAPLPLITPSNLSIGVEVTDSKLIDKFNTAAEELRGFIKNEKDNLLKFEAEKYGFVPEDENDENDVSIPRLYSTLDYSSQVLVVEVLEKFKFADSRLKYPDKAYETLKVYIDGLKKEDPPIKGSKTRTTQFVLNLYKVQVPDMMEAYVANYKMWKLDNPSETETPKPPATETPKKPEPPVEPEEPITPPLSPEPSAPPTPSPPSPAPSPPPGSEKEETSTSLEEPEVPVLASIDPDSLEGRAKSINFVPKPELQNPVMKDPYLMRLNSLDSDWVDLLIELSNKPMRQKSMIRDSFTPSIRALVSDDLAQFFKL